MKNKNKKMTNQETAKMILAPYIQNGIVGVEDREKFHKIAPLDDFLNPNYHLFELLKQVLYKYKEGYGESSALAGANSVIYHCYLNIFSALSSCADLDVLEDWEIKFKRENPRFNNINFK